MALFDFDYNTLQETIYAQVSYANEKFVKCVKFMKTDPTVIFDTTGVFADAQEAVQSVSISLVIIFFLIDFFKKTTDYHWIKWENLIVFFAKVLLAKTLVQNSVSLMRTIYRGFSGILDKMFGSAAVTSFLPTDRDGATRIFLSDAEITALSDLSKQSDFFYADCLIKSLTLQPIFLILQIVSILVYVIVIGRAFEIIVYTFAAPLPLSTLAGDGTHEVAKGFLKSYIAAVLQVIVIVIMFQAFAGLMGRTEIQSLTGGALIVVSAFAMGVMKSGAWSKKLCGAS